MAGTGPGDLFTQAQALLAASVQALDTIPILSPGLGGAPERAYVAPGLPALDCCPQLTVDVRGVSEDGPPFTGSGQKPRYGARKNQVLLVATIVRCVPTEPITTDALEAEAQDAAEQIDADGWALWNYLYNLVRSGDLFRLCADTRPELRQLAPSGGCAGWVFSIRVEVEGYEP